MSILKNFIFTAVLFWSISNAKYAERNIYHVKFPRTVLQPIGVQQKNISAPTLDFVVYTDYGLQSHHKTGEYKNKVYGVINPSIPVETISQRMSACFESKTKKDKKSIMQLSGGTLQYDKTKGKLNMTNFYNFIKMVGINCDGSLNKPTKGESVAFKDYYLQNHGLDIDCRFRVPLPTWKDKKQHAALYSIINPDEKFATVNRKLRNCLLDYEKNPTKLSEPGIEPKLQLLRECQNSQDIIKKGLRGLCENNQGIFTGKATVKDEPKPKPKPASPPPVNAKGSKGGKSRSRKGKQAPAPIAGASNTNETKPEDSEKPKNGTKPNSAFKVTIYIGMLCSLVASILAA